MGKVFVAAVIAATSGVSCAAFAASPLHEGFYVGHGDGSEVVIQILPGNSVRIGAFNENEGVSTKTVPVNPSNIVKAVDGKTCYQGKCFSNGFLGTVKTLGNGKYALEFSFKGQPTGLPCVKYYQSLDDGNKLKGIGFKNFDSCAAMHGASWSYGEDLHTVLTYRSEIHR